MSDDLRGVTRRLWNVLGGPQKRSLGLLMAASVLTALAELGLLAAVVPFALALASPEGGAGELHDQTRFSIAGAGLLFLLAIVVASTMRLIALMVQVRCVKGIAEYLSVRSYWRTLVRPYIEHVNSNTSDIIATLTSRLDNVIHAVIISLIAGSSQFVIAVSIIIALLVTSVWVTAILLICVVGAYSLFLYRSRRVVRRESERHNRAIFLGTRVLSESLAGVRDVLLTGSQQQCRSSYQEAQHVLRDASARLSVTSAAPRIVVEAIGFVAIVAVACALAATPSSAARAVPILAVVILGSQRLLPVAQGLFVSWTNFKAGLPHLLELLTMLEQPDRPAPVVAEPLPFREALELRGLRYTYPGTSTPAVAEASLRIKAGSVVGIIGRTGCGKSTLLDLVMGLLSSDQGDLVVDGMPLSGDHLPQWQRGISHVAQNIFLADATIGANIALGSPGSFDAAAIRDAARLADLDDFVSGLPLGYETNVGERGIRLSGGQRQRIGIARALYRKTGFLVLDEATSSLDQETEASVMRGLVGGAETRTILIVTHRLSTLRICDEIYRMSGGRLEGPLSYSDIAT